MKKTGYSLIVACTVVCTFSVCAAQPLTRTASLDPGLQKFASEFFSWRAATQPCSYDDIPRLERPKGWVPDFSAASLADQRSRYREFSKRLRALPRAGWSRADSVDYLLLRSAVERIHWELDILRAPFRNPDFYIQQTLEAVLELLLLSPPMNDARMNDILFRLESFPGIAKHAKENLTEPVVPFANLALANLQGVRTRLTKMAAGLKEVADKKHHARLDRAVSAAAGALEEYADWLRQCIPTMDARFSVGKEAYENYLQTIALIPRTPEEMLTLGRSEFERAVSWETIERNRNANLPGQQLFSSAQEQIEQEQRDELAIRKFLEEKNLLTIPVWVGHYRNRLMPSYIDALADLGTTDDLTSDARLHEDGFSYIPPPSPGLSYFRRACAQDPRPIVIHEGVPGHYFQLVLSWAHEDPIRRRYFDSGSNEGYAFYVEEMLLQAGLFEIDRPRTREIMYSFMRLRALRVEVDIRLALGQFTVAQAGEYLTATVPMDRQTAEAEASFFASNPGQAISYQIGKLQIQQFLKDARFQFGDAFRLREFHDYIAKNGNVPIALLRWEYLGRRDEIDRLW